MKAKPIFDALAALRAIDDAPVGTIPHHLWSQCMRARSALESAVIWEDLQVSVEQEKEAQQ